MTESDHFAGYIDVENYTILLKIIHMSREKRDDLLFFDGTQAVGFIDGINNGSEKLPPAGH